MPRTRSPKRGSLSYSPRKRASNPNGRIVYWPKVKDGPQLVGFAGYKSGMTHLFYIEDRERVPEYGQEIKSAVTVIDTPPMLICAIRVYKKTQDGLEAITEAWMENQPIELHRRINFTTDPNPQENLSKMDRMIDEIDTVRVLAATQPRETGIAKKKPDIMEIPISGGTIREQLDYAKELFGKTVSVNDVFKPGEGVDVVGVTKGKGFQGPVKRWGIRILSRKSRKTKRGVASIGPWVPRRVMPQVPRAGQMGYHNRTEYNKRIMLMGKDPEKINPVNGYRRYGEVKGEYMVLQGSVMGPPKRLIKLRKAVRSPGFPEQEPQITYLHTEWKRSKNEQ